MSRAFMPAIDGAPRVAPRDHPLERAARGRWVPGPRTGALVPSAGPLAMTGGEPLPGADRRYFEQRLGHDFSAVRLHADERGAALASGLHALAFTSGTHIGFGEGRYRPSTSAGRALIGHELMHVAQVQAAGAGSGAAAMLWLARRADPDPARGPPFLEVEIGTERPQTATPRRFPIGAEGSQVDATRIEIFDGDIVAVRIGREMGNTDPKTVLGDPLEIEALPASMERIEGGPFDWAQLRAVQPDAAVSLTLRSTRSPGLTVGVALRIAATPSMQPSAVAGADGGSDRLSSRRARRRARRDERRAWRERVGALRGGDRGALKEARADRRRQRQAAREQRRLAAAQDDVFALRTEIDAARLRGIEACDATIAALMARPRPGSVVAKALLDIMKIDAPEISPGRERVEHVLDVLRGARNGLAAAKLSDFVAGDLDDPTELAEAQGNVRGGKVTLSSAWRLGTLQSREPARGVDDVRAFVLLHEFIHLAGPFEANEIYVFDRKAWAARSAEQLLQMADAYAALAWVVGTGEQR